jgi:ParB/RepB/Spo0J family partition protein
MWSASDDDSDSIKELAQSIVAVGQINPIEVRWKINSGATDPSDGQYAIVTGRRRLEAIRSLGDGFMVKATVLEVDDKKARQHALQENAKRKDPSAMDNAQNIAEVREREGWKGGKNTSKVAEYFGMSVAWVTTHEKLLGLDKSQQSRIQSNGWSAQAAFDLIGVQYKKRGEVQQRAEEIADKEAKDKGKPRRRVKSRHVRQAAQETQASSKPKQRKTREVVEFFERFDVDEYGRPDGVVRQFIVYLNKWLAGQGTDRTLTEKFDDIATFVPNGVIPKVARKPVKKVVKPKPKK